MFNIEIYDISFSGSFEFFVCFSFWRMMNNEKSLGPFVLPQEY